MRRLLLVLALLFTYVTATRAETISDSDRQAFARIITEQIEAFRADDGPRAYGYAAPLIQQSFPTPDAFMAMVRQGYQPVYRPQSFDFNVAAGEDGAEPRQRVRVVGPDGKSYVAVYTFERQSDGSWKISGCYLKGLPGLDA